MLTFKTLTFIKTEEDGDVDMEAEKADLNGMKAEKETLTRPELESQTLVKLKSKPISKWPTITTNPGTPKWLNSPKFGHFSTALPIEEPSKPPTQTRRKSVSKHPGRKELPSKSPIVISKFQNQKSV
ncbi:uncharacterized protein DFL_003088 [Arthrobotrys flagrans]|uniref:Uncharacterized protein n=1 Tax=Arthrobotrys flagrans TaxID=97331 RepID=A0A437ACE0_ARTFL|nr:hypothetical protein DFL_003088 [Arthrobotrys flagrans]